MTLVLVTVLVYRACNVVFWFLVAVPWSVLPWLLRRGLLCCDCCLLVSFVRLVGVLGMSMYTLLALQLRSGALKLLLSTLLLLFSCCFVAVMMIMTMMIVVVVVSDPTCEVAKPSVFNIH